MVEMERRRPDARALVDAELQPSRGRKTIALNAVISMVKNNPILNTSLTMRTVCFGRYTLLRRGKERYCLICWK